MDKVSGLANEAVGNVKQGVGKVVGSDKLHAEGLAQEAKGEAQKFAGDVKSTVGR
ncbi:MAG: CsbD family protein [Beijerinckiaceae bacterium]